MNITFATTHLTFMGGAGKVILDYANRFSKMNHNVVIIAQKVDRTIFKFDDKILILEIGGSLPSSFLYWLLFKKIKKKYLKVLNRLNCDIFFSHLFPTNYFCAKISKKKDYKHIYYCHEPFRFFHDKKFYSNLTIISKIRSWLLRILFKKFDIKGTLKAYKVLCNSNFTKKRIKEIYGIKSSLIYPVVDLKSDYAVEKLNIRQKLNLSKDIPIIFTLGLTHHMKGARELIIIFKRVIEKVTNAVLLIGGWITKENKLIIEKMMKILKIPREKVIFYGPIDQSHLNSFYEESTITFYTAIDEPFGLIPIESMNNGTPVIVFNGGPSESIQNGINGYIISNYDLRDFAQKAIKLLKNKSLHERFSINAKIHIKKSFSFENSFSNLLTFFLDAIS